VTVDGRLLHALAAETGNARSPSVDLRVTGTTSDDVLDDRWLGASYNYDSTSILRLFDCLSKAIKVAWM